jgi:hypothetical protein
MVNNEELIGTTEYLMLQTKCRINRCRYSRVRLYIKSTVFWDVTPCGLIYI